MANQIWKSLTVGLKRRKWDATRYAFGAVGALWTVTEVLTRGLKALDVSIDNHGFGFLVLMAVTFAGVFIGYVIEPTRVTFKVPGSDTNITLKYGDLFAEPANLLIGVNEFFDGELGMPVDPGTVHGQFIRRNCQSSAAEFRAAVDPALAATGAAPEHRARPQGHTSAYPIGTTAKVANGAHSAFLMAMARTNVATSKAASDVPTLWTALQGGLRAVYDHGNSHPLALPLLGNGQSGVKMEPQNLLRLIVLALVDFATNSSARLPKQVTIALHDSCFDKLDIREIARDWKKA